MILVKLIILNCVQNPTANNCFQVAERSYVCVQLTFEDVIEVREGRYLIIANYSDSCKPLGY